MNAPRRAVHGDGQFVQASGVQLTTTVASASASSRPLGRAPSEEALVEPFARANFASFGRCAHRDVAAARPVQRHGEASVLPRRRNSTTRWRRIEVLRLEQVEEAGAVGRLSPTSRLAEDDRVHGAGALGRRDASRRDRARAP